MYTTSNIMPPDRITDSEILWKSIIGYEGIYEVSNTGLIRSLDRVVRNSYKSERLAKGRLISLNFNGHYYCVHLYKNDKRSVKYIHRLVIEAFNGYSNLEVDHKDGNTKNNHLSNLRYCTHRANAVYRSKRINEFTGVSKIKGSSLRKYRAIIKIDGKDKYLGSFNTKKEAHEAYMNEYNKQNDQCIPRQI